MSVFSSKLLMWLAVLCVGDNMYPILSLTLPATPLSGIGECPVFCYCHTQSVSGTQSEGSYVGTSLYVCACMYPTVPAKEGIVGYHDLQPHTNNLLPGDIFSIIALAPLPRAYLGNNVFWRCCCWLRPVVVQYDRRSANYCFCSFFHQVVCCQVCFLARCWPTAVREKNMVCFVLKCLPVAIFYLFFFLDFWQRAGPVPLFVLHYRESRHICPRNYGVLVLCYLDVKNSE